MNKYSNIARAGLVLIVAATLLVACSSGGGLPMQPPDEPPAPTLLGTWQLSDEWTTQEGISMSVDRRLTFTAGERAVAVASYYADGAFESTYSNSSGWTADENTVTRLWYTDTSEDEVVNPVHGSVAKSYHWIVDDRSEVLIEAWYATEDSLYFEKWERVPADSLPSIIGTWVFDGDHRDWRMEFRADGSLEFVRTQKSDGAVRVWRGTTSLDVSTYTATITNFTEEQRDSVGNVTHEARPRRDGTATMAFVPSARGMSVSLWQGGRRRSPVRRLLVALRAGRSVREVVSLHTAASAGEDALPVSLTGVEKLSVTPRLVEHSLTVSLM